MGPDLTQTFKVDKKGQKQVKIGQIKLKTFKIRLIKSKTDKLDRKFN